MAAYRGKNLDKEGYDHEVGSMVALAKKKLLAYILIMPY